MIDELEASPPMVMAGDGSFGGEGGDEGRQKSGGFGITDPDVVGVRAKSAEQQAWEDVDYEEHYNPECLNPRYSGRHISGWTRYLTDTRANAELGFLVFLPRFRYHVGLSHQDYPRESLEIRWALSFFRSSVRDD